MVLELSSDVKCNRIVGWWHIFTEKIMPLRQKWSEEEHKAMR